MELNQKYYIENIAADLEFEEDIAAILEVNKDSGWDGDGFRGRRDLSGGPYHGLMGRRELNQEDDMEDIGAVWDVHLTDWMRIEALLTYQFYIYRWPLTLWTNMRAVLH